MSKETEREEIKDETHELGDEQDEDEEDEWKVMTIARWLFREM
jgi:hypothetical protein